TSAIGFAFRFGAGSGLPAKAGSTGIVLTTTSTVVLMTETVPFPELATYVRAFSVVATNNGAEAAQPLVSQSWGRLMVVAWVGVLLLLAETVSSPLFAT